MTKPSRSEPRLTKRNRYALALRRARRLAAQGQPARAHAYFTHAADLFETASIRRSEGLMLLHEQLDLCEDWLAKDAPELVNVARRLDELAAGSDARALHVLGLASALDARRALFRNPEKDDWRRLGASAQQQLERAAELAAFDPEVWSALGGLRKRIGLWHQRRGETEAAEEQLLAAAKAYLSGWHAAPNANPLLNFIELNALLHPKDPVVPDQYALGLVRALQERRHEYQSGQDLPWAAFDLARGLYYQTQNLGLHLEWLKRGIDKAGELDTSARRHALRATALSLELVATRPDLEPLSASVGMLNDHLADARFNQAQWLLRDRAERERIGAINQKLEGFLKQLERPDADLTSIWEELERTLAEVEIQLKADEQEALETELAQFREDVTPREQKLAQLLWKALGSDAMEAVLSCVGLPGTPIVKKLLVALTSPEQTLDSVRPSSR